MSVKIRISDKINKYPPTEYKMEVDPSLADRYWYKTAINGYAAAVGHPKFNPKTMEARQYYDRFWAEIIRETATIVQPAPVVSPPPPSQTLNAVAVVTAQGAGRMFTVNRKGTDYSFLSVLSDEEAIAACLTITNPKDREFANSLLSKRPHLTPKQLAWVHKIALDQLKTLNDPRALNNPAPPPPPPVYSPNYSPGPVKSRYKRSKSYWPKGSQALDPQEIAAIEKTNQNFQNNFPELAKKALEEKARMEAAKDEFPADADSVDASSLGLKAGDFPQTIEFNGMSYTRCGEDTKDGELTAVKYHSDNVFYLRVFND